MKHLVILTLFFLTACQTVEPLSPDQRRALQVRSFSNVSYNTVFRAFKTVMQDEGYIIKNQDFEGGLIVAESQKQAGAGGFEILHAVSIGLSGGGGSAPQRYRTGQVFSWSVNLEEIKKNVVESRIILQMKDLYSGGGHTGREVLSPGTYQNIYVKVQREINRRKALKRK